MSASIIKVRAFFSIFAAEIRLVKLFLSLQKEAAWRKVVRV